MHLHRILIVCLAYGFAGQFALQRVDETQGQGPGIPQGRVQPLKRSRLHKRSPHNLRNSFWDGPPVHPNLALLMASNSTVNKSTVLEMLVADRNAQLQYYFQDATHSVDSVNNGLTNINRYMRETGHGCFMIILIMGSTGFLLVLAYMFPKNLTGTGGSVLTIKEKGQKDIKVTSSGKLSVDEDGKITAVVDLKSF